MRPWLRRLQAPGLIGLAAVVLLLANGLGWLSIAGFAQDGLRPISSRLTRAGQTAGLKLSEISHVGRLGDANRALEADNARLLEQIAKLKEVERENEQLRKQLQFPAKSSSQLLGADIIGFQPDGLRKLLVINRGADDGLRAGMAVIASGQLVGKLHKVDAHSSQLLLVTDEQFRALVIDQNTRAPGIVKGQIGGGVVMERIPQHQAINSGDVIVTSGADGEFAPGLVIGTVSAVSQDAQSIFNAAKLKQAFEPLDLRIVMVVVTP